LNGDDINVDDAPLVSPIRQATRSISHQTARGLVIDISSTKASRRKMRQLLPHAMRNRSLVPSSLAPLSGPCTDECLH
jgi:hypothetical protein